MRREDERARGSESVGQTGADRYLDREDKEEERQRDRPSFPQHITHITGTECCDRSSPFHLHINRFLLITAGAACVSGNLHNISTADHHNAAGIQSTKRQRGHAQTDTHRKAQESEANPIPAPCNGIPPIPSARC